MDLDSPSQQLVGAVFNGRWRLIRLVGEGGMGAVFEAHGTRGEGVRAVKVLHHEFTTEEQILSRFFAEAQATQQLHHPNVAQIYEATRAEDGTPYLTMEFLKGMPLTDFMKPGQGVAADVGAPIMYGVLQALALAHSRGVIHRDLKPDNLFLVPVGDGTIYQVKVLDFGIAKVMDAAGGMGSKTKTGVLLGTPGYMSPEQIKNSKSVDARSDLWSVGVILYEMLTGREAFPADNEFARLTAVLTQDIPPIAQVRPDLAMWSQFFQRALSKAIETRFQSAQEMAQALTAMLTPQGKSPSAQGRDWGTVVLSLPNRESAPSQVASSAAQAARVPNYGTAAFQQPQTPPQQQPYSHQRGPQTVNPASVQAISMQVPPAHSPSMVPSQQYQSRPPGPSTHMSAQGPVGSVARPPDVQVVTPMGFPTWVVVAVFAAGLAVGFVLGAIVV
jgi:eukaryotic-like serine/threonine-protein kinase